MGELIDTTEMYLRIVYELEEDGITPLRARIAERLGQSGPTVSQTVARMERDGLVVVADDRHLELTATGQARAVSVMRKHRLAERLLSDVIGLEWEFVHAEACRWEHVMSEAVERKLVALLGDPVVSPYGNPIPGLDALDGSSGDAGLPRLPAEAGLVRLDELARAGGGAAVVHRIAEWVQDAVDDLRELRSCGVVPAAHLRVGPMSRGGFVPVETGTGPATLSAELAHAVLVAINR